MGNRLLGTGRRVVEDLSHIFGTSDEEPELPQLSDGSASPPRDPFALDFGSLFGIITSNFDTDQLDIPPRPITDGLPAVEPQDVPLCMITSIVPSVMDSDVDIPCDNIFGDTFVEIEPTKPLKKPESSRFAANPQNDILRQLGSFLDQICPQTLNTEECEIIYNHANATAEECPVELMNHTFGFYEALVPILSAEALLGDHPIKDLLYSSAHNIRAEYRDYSVLVLSRIFVHVYDEHSVSILQTHSFGKLTELAAEMRSALLRQSVIAEWRRRQTFCKLIALVFEEIGRRAPAAVLLGVFGEDLNQIADSSNRLIRQYYPLCVGHLGAEYLRFLRSPISDAILRRLNAMSRMDEDAESRQRAASALGDVDLAADAEDFENIYSATLNDESFKPVDERSLYAEPWTELPHWMSPFHDYERGMRAIAEAMQSSQVDDQPAQPIQQQPTPQINEFSQCCQFHANRGESLI